MWCSWHINPGQNILGVSQVQDKMCLFPDETPHYFSVTNEIILNDVANDLFLLTYIPAVGCW